LSRRKKAAAASAMSTSTASSARRSDNPDDGVRAEAFRSANAFAPRRGRGRREVRICARRFTVLRGVVVVVVVVETVLVVV
jgi:hypothetical protein